jgi:secreted trypsin-like serine protease
LKQTWAPGVYGNWEEFEGKIKEAAATYASPGFKKDLKKMIFEGHSKKRDGSTRFWDHAEATGNYFVSRDGSVMLEVHDLSKRDK